MAARQNEVVMRLNGTLKLWLSLGGLLLASGIAWGVLTRKVDETDTMCRTNFVRSIGNERDTAVVKSRLERIDARQARMDTKLDRIWEKIR